MKNILEDLYFGEIQPNVMALSERQEIKADVTEENQKALIKMLSGEEKELLIDIISSHEEMKSEIAVMNFTYGFKLGVRLAAESILVL
ncbi:MAG: hypothetical protein FWG90_04025 [Oscillospiraceae bacterium]|nr:hypothetical protein [Oscillospiraceae bacterium]